jgi:hypothetical protein
MTHKKINLMTKTNYFKKSQRMVRSPQNKKKNNFKNIKHLVHLPDFDELISKSCVSIGISEIDGKFYLTLARRCKGLEEVLKMNKKFKIILDNCAAEMVTEDGILQQIYKISFHKVCPTNHNKIMRFMRQITDYDACCYSRHKINVENVNNIVELLESVGTRIDGTNGKIFIFKFRNYPQK